MLPNALTVRQQVAHMKAVARARGRKLKLRPFRRPAQPAAQEDAYIKALKRIAGKFALNVMRHVQPVLNELGREQRAQRTDAAARIIKPWRGNAHALIGQIKATMPDFAKDKAVRDMVMRHGRALESMSSDQMTKLLGSSLGVDVLFEDAGMAAALETLTEQNVALIQSIGEEQLAQVEELLLKGLHEGIRVETLAKQLGERFEVSESRAQLIATDQTLKFYSAANQMRMNEAGLNRYTWRTVGDGKVRDRHKELDGEVFSFDDPPETNDAGDKNNPGEDYQCRCWAEPIVTDLLGED